MGGEPLSGNGNASPIKYRYSVVLFENGNLTVENFPVDVAVATFMHVWAWAVIRDFFKAKQGRVVIPTMTFPGP